MQPHCHEVFSSSQDHILAATLFVGALIGSISHCAGMCGPFVIAQVSGFSAPEGKNPEKWYRFLLIPYHIGRLTTYVLLGVAATAISAPLHNIPALNIVSPLLLVVAGVLFLASAFSQLLPRKYFNFKFNLCGTPHWIMQRVALVLPSNSVFGGYVLGVLLGFLPCGLVYAAVVTVVATGDVLESAVGMMAFAVGTMPMLMAIALGGRMLINKQYKWIKPASAIMMAFNSMVLFAMAGKGFV